MKQFLVALSIAIIASSTQSAFAKVDTKSSVDRNKETARIWFEDVIVKEDHKGVEKILAKGIVLELPPSMKSTISKSHVVSGKEQVMKHWSGFGKGHDVAGTIVYLIGDGNKVALLRTVTAKHAEGTAEGLPVATFFEFDEEGKIAKIRHVMDTAHLFKTLKTQKKDS